MKKKALTTLTFIILSITIALGITKNTVAHSLTDDTIYCYIPAATTLYAKTDIQVTDTESESDPDTEPPVGYTPITMLPATYFVALIGDTHEDGYYYVNYQDLSGYILKTSVEVCDYEPVTKYTFGILTMNFDKQNVNLRAKPDHADDDNILAQIPSSTQVSYYGTAQGSALFESLGTTWYYVRYEHEGETLHGYIYSAQANVEAISPNVIEKVERPASPGDDTPEITDTPPSFGSLTNIIFIICLCIPAILIVIMIFKRPSQKRVPRHYRNDE